MKIAFASPISVSRYAGCEKWIVGTANALKQRGHDVSIYATPYTPERNVDVDDVLSRGIDYHEAWRFNLEDYDIVYMVYTPIVWRLFSTNNPKIAGFHYHLCLPSDIEKRVLENIPSALRHYDVISILTYWSFKLLGKRDIQNFNAVHIPNNPFNVSLAHERIFFVPNWIDLDFYRPTKSKHDVFTILFVGRHDWEKGWWDYNAICRLLKKFNLDIRCISTGRGSSYVEGLGFLSDRELVDTYSSAHLLVYPSKSDMFGLVIVEAIACNTPVITTSIAAHKALNLPLIYADSVDEFVSKIILIYKLWSRDGEYEDMIRGLREHVAKYDVNKIMPGFEDMLRQVATET